MSNATPQEPQNTGAQPTVPQPTAPQQQFTVPQPTATQPYAATQQYPAVPPQPAPAYSAAPRKPEATTMGLTNTYAVLAIIFAFIAPLAGIIFGHLSLGQIKRTGDAGRGIALTGLIVSYAYFVLIALFFIFYIGFIVVLIGTAGTAFTHSSTY
ncbi:DUF4190 domain-containing protein [Leucobacter iarius]|uniref:DUF4190 domain-containing protein n=1 Tax=Leucobacter iarius TaxID=333963 RepID=A0ABN2LDI4_9MICO